MKSALENKDEILKSFQENPDKLEEVKKKVDILLEDKSLIKKAVALKEKREYYEEE